MSASDLAQLPTDLVLAIAEFLPDASLYALLLTSRCLFEKLDRALYVRDARHNNSFVLRWAAHRGIVSSVKKALAAGADPNAGSQLDPQDLYETRLRSYTRDSALSIAAGAGNMEIASLLLAAGALVDIPRRDSQMPPLFAAVERDRLDMVKFLLERGNISLGSVVEIRGIDLLAHAIRHASPGLVGYVLDNITADFDNPMAESPLISSVRAKRSDLLPLFLSSDKLNPSHPDRAGRTALMHATMPRPPTSVSEGMFKILLDSGKFDPNSFDDEGKTIFAWACIAGSESNVRSLLAREDVDPNVLDNYGRQPASYCVEDFQMMQILFNSNKVNYDANQLFRSACLENAADVAEEMLKRHGAAGTVDHKGATWLHIASKYDCADIVKILLERSSIDIDQQMLYGRTALMRSLRDSFEIRGAAAKLLLQAGANVRLVDKQGWSALAFAAQIQNSGIVESILKRGADVGVVTDTGDTALHIASWHGWPDNVRVLLANGANASLYNHNKKTPLQLIQGGGDKLVSLLLAHGADVNASDNDGTTLLHDACLRQDRILVDHLLKSGANVAATKTNGSTPLHEACLGEADPRGWAAAWVLLQHGADVNTAMLDGRTPLHIACQRDYETMANLCIVNGADPLAAFNDGTGRRMTAIHLGCLPRAHLGNLSTMLKALPEPAKRDLLATGWTPLHEAASNLNGAAAELLLQHGADPNVAAEGGRTPLHVMFSSPLLESTLVYTSAPVLSSALLGAEGIDVNSRDDGGNTPMDVAIDAPSWLREKLRVAGGKHGSEL